MGNEKNGRGSVIRNQDAVTTAQPSLPNRSWLVTRYADKREREMCSRADQTRADQTRLREKERAAAAAAAVEKEEAKEKGSD